VLNQLQKGNVANDRTAELKILKQPTRGVLEVLVLCDSLKSLSERCIVGDPKYGWQVLLTFSNMALVWQHVVFREKLSEREKALPTAPEKSHFSLGNAFHFETNYALAMNLDSSDNFPE